MRDAAVRTVIPGNPPRLRRLIASTPKPSRRLRIRSNHRKLQQDQTDQSIWCLYKLSATAGIERARRKANNSIPLHHSLECPLAQIRVVGQLIEDGDQARELIATAVCYHRRHASGLHLGVLVAEFHKARVEVSPCNRSYTVFDGITDIRLEHVLALKSNHLSLPSFRKEH